MKSGIARRPGRPRVTGLAERRREEILAAATRLFAERGYPATDIQVLADALGVGKGTVYRYFSTKESLFLAAVDRSMRLLRQAVDAAASGAEDPIEKVERAAAGYLAFFEEHPASVELLIQERAEFKDRKKPTYFVHREANLGPWRDLFRGLMDAGRVRRLPVDDVVDVLSHALYGAMFTSYFAGRRLRSAEHARRVLDVVLNGILTDRERKRSSP